VARSNLRIVLLVATLFAAGDVLAESPAATPAKEMLVYDTALAPGWQNQSDATTELSIEASGSARKPIGVVAGPGQSLNLHHEPFSTAGLSKLTMLIQGSAPNGEVRIFAIVDGKAVGIGRPVKLGNTGWTEVVTPLATLGVKGKTIDGLWIQNSTGADLPKFYVTEIKIL